MSCSRYLIICKEQPLSIAGANGGAEMATRRLAQYLARSGIEVVVAANLGGSDATLDGVDYWDYGANYQIENIFDRAAKKFGTFHLLAVNRAHPLIESRSRREVLSRIFISHDRHGSDAGISLQIVSQIADRILAVSEAHRGELIRAGADAQRTEVIYNGVDFDIFRVGNFQQRDTQKIVFAGALVQDKGLHVLLQAYAQLKGQIPGISLDIYGSAALWGRESIFDQEALQRQLPGVTFHGAVDSSRLAHAFQSSGVCVFPSIWFECFPLVSLEAQASGCPVIAFDVGGVKEGIVHGSTGLVLENISVEALTEALGALVRNPEQQRLMGTAAAEHVRNKFTWEKVVAKVTAAAEEANRRGVRHATIQTPVGVITTWNQQCGLATYAQYLFSQMKKGSVVVFAEDTSDAEREKDQPWVTRCWQRRGDDLLLLERSILDSGVRLLHLNFHDHSFIEQTHLLPLLDRLRQRGIAIVSHLHTTYADDARLRQFIAHVDHLIVHSAESRLQLVALGARPERTHVLPHGVFPVPRAVGGERERIRSALMPNSAAKLIVSFGFIQPNKGVEAVIEGVAHLTSRGIAAHGYIAGKLNEAHPQSKLYFEELQQYAHRLGVASRIVFANRFLGEQEVADCLAVADLVTMNYSSTYYEASGACARAIGAGALVAASLSPNFTCFGDAVWHLTSGFPIGISAELLFTNQELANQIRANAERYIGENNWSSIAVRLAVLYHEWGFELVQSKFQRATAVASETLTDAQIDQLAESGEEALRNGNNSKARETLLGLIARAPHAERALRALGTLALTEKNVSEAQGYFHKAIALQPTNAKTLGGLGMCAMSEGDMNKAHEYLLESLAHDPHFLLGLKNLIQTSFTLEKYEDLERSIREYLTLHPENEEIHYCLAGCLHKKGDHAGALRALEAILERSPGHALADELQRRILAEHAPRDSQISRESAQIDLRLSELEEAKRQKLLDAVYRGLEELEQRALSTAQMERLFILRGETLTMDGQFNSAERCFKQVLEVDPECGRAMSGMGAICTAREDLETAEQWFKRALLRHERVDIAFTGLGVCAQWRGNSTLAWEYYRKALTVNPENEQALYGVVQIGMLRRSFSDVEDSLRNYLEFRPANLDHIYSLAGCLYAQQKFVDALDELDKVLLFEPRHANAIELKNIIISRTAASESGA